MSLHAQIGERSDEPNIDARDAWLYNREAAFYQSDTWMVHYQKVLTCPQTNPHSWVDCPFAHKGERAKRRDLRTYSYSSDPCASAKKNLPCPKGDACDKSHHVYESWLHPELYRTRMCAAGARCVRRVCFFAHSAVQLRRPTRPLCSTADGQPLSLQEQQDGGVSDGEASTLQDVDYAALVEPWPESWGFGAIAAASAAAAAAEEPQAEGDRQAQQKQQAGAAVKQQRLSSSSADEAGSNRLGQHSAKPVVGAAKVTSMRGSADLTRRQQQRQQQQQEVTVASAANPGAGVTLLQLQQQEYLQQQQCQAGSNTSSRQSSSGDASVTRACSSLASTYHSMMQQQQQQYGLIPSPDLPAAAAAHAAGPAGPWSPCSTGNCSRQWPGYAAQHLLPADTAAAAAVTACGGGPKVAAGMGAAAGAAAGFLHSSMKSEVQHCNIGRHQHVTLYPAQQQQMLGSACLSSLIASGVPTGRTQAGQSLELQPPAAKAPTGAAATSAAAHDALVQSLAVANAAAAAKQLAQLQLLGCNAHSSDTQFSDDYLGPGWGLSHSDGISLSRYGSGLSSAASGLARSSYDHSSMTRSSCDYAGWGLTAPGWGVTSQGSNQTLSGTGLAAPGWGSNLSGLATSGSSGLAAPGWNVMTTHPSGPVAAATAHCLPGQEWQPTAHMLDQQQQQALRQQPNLPQRLNAAALHSLQQGLGNQAGFNHPSCTQQGPTLQGVPGLYPVQCIPPSGPGAAYSAYSSGLGAAVAAGLYQTNSQAVSLPQHMFDAAARARRAAAMAAATVADGMLTAQYMVDSNSVLYENRSQAAFQYQQSSSQ